MQITPLLSMKKKKRLLGGMLKKKSHFEYQFISKFISNSYLHSFSTYLIFS